MNNVGLLVLLLLASAEPYGEQHVVVDAPPGKALHAEECLLCHDSGHYTRQNRLMQNLDQLKSQVDRCQGDVGAEWTAEQVGDVVTYLNETFYHFQN